MFTESMKTALAAETVRLIMAVEIEWPNEMTRAHTGIGDLHLNEELFKGVGNIGSISSIEQKSGDSPSRLQLGLSSFDDSVRGEVLRAQYHGRAVTVWMVALNEHYQPEASQVIWKGSIVDATVSIGESNQLEVVVSNRMEDWDKKRPDRFTDESQQARHTGDRLFRYITIMTEWPIYWGSDKQATPLRDSI